MSESSSRRESRYHRDRESRDYKKWEGSGKRRDDRDRDRYDRDSRYDREKERDRYDRDEKERDIRERDDKDRDRFDAKKRDSYVRSEKTKSERTSDRASTKERSHGDSAKRKAVDVTSLPTDDEEAAMKTLMGFGGFDTTKGKHVAGNEVYVAAVHKKRKYRQYMNRRGGFNRPLDPIV